MCSELTNCGNLNPFYADACKVKATLGYTYLVHIVSSCMNFGFYFALADHSFVLMRTNSGYVQAFTMDVVIVQPGQLVDVLVIANHIFGKFYMVGTPFSVAPYSTVSSQSYTMMPFTLSKFCWKPWVYCVGPRDWSSWANKGITNLPQ